MTTAQAALPAMAPGAMPSPAEPVIRAAGIEVHYRLDHNGTVLRAVDGVDMLVHRGQTFGVIGESGSGKSTLGRVVAFMQAPTGGRLWHGEIEPVRLRGAASRAHRRRTVMIHQDPDAALDPRMTILQSVREPLDIEAARPRGDRVALALRSLAAVGLGPEHAARYPHELSGGQKQRVNIARALTLRPDVLVCDEVVSALDVSTQADVLNLLADLQQEYGLTYVFISHNLAVVAHVSDMVAVMYLGRFVEVGTPTQILHRPRHPYTQALLSAEPVPLPSEMRTSRRIILEGEVPSPVAPPSGCRFRTRCPVAQAVCAQADPAWRTDPDGHAAACHFA